MSCLTEVIASCVLANVDEGINSWLNVLEGVTRLCSYGFLSVSSSSTTENVDWTRGQIVGDLCTVGDLYFTERGDCLDVGFTGDCFTAGLLSVTEKMEQNS